MDWQTIKHVLISVLVGALVAFLTSFMTGLLAALQHYLQANPAPLSAVITYLAQWKTSQIG